MVQERKRRGRWNKETSLVVLFSNSRFSEMPLREHRAKGACPDYNVIAVLISIVLFSWF